MVPRRHDLDALDDALGGKAGAGSGYADLLLRLALDYAEHDLVCGNEDRVQPANRLLIEEAEHRRQLGRANAGPVALEKVRRHA
jgi:hypothetical protein